MLRHLPSIRVASASLGLRTTAARKLAAKPPAALRLSKMLMKKVLTEAVARQMSDEAAHFGTQRRSPEAAEAFNAFFEKRAPDFSKFG